MMIKVKYFLIILLLILLRIQRSDFEEKALSCGASTTTLTLPHHYIGVWVNSFEVEDSERLGVVNRYTKFVNNVELIRVTKYAVNKDLHIVFLANDHKEYYLNLNKIRQTNSNDHIFIPVENNNALKATFPKDIQWVDVNYDQCFSGNFAFIDFIFRLFFWVLLVMLIIQLSLIFRKKILKRT